MRMPRPFQSIAERIEEALAAATQAQRTPVSLVLGKQDYLDFKAWRSASEGDAAADSHRGIPVRLNAPVYMSCLELVPSPGLPNAIKL